jgi:hypothetical protein
VVVEGVRLLVAVAEDGDGVLALVVRVGEHFLLLGDLRLGDLRLGDLRLGDLRKKGCIKFNFYDSVPDRGSPLSASTDASIQKGQPHIRLSEGFMSLS